MNKMGKCLLFVMVLCTLMIPIPPATTFANSGEPPSLIILIDNPLYDLSI